MWDWFSLCLNFVKGERGFQTLFMPLVIFLNFWSVPKRIIQCVQRSWNIVQVNGRLIFWKLPPITPEYFLCISEIVSNDLLAVVVVVAPAAAVDLLFLCFSMQFYQLAAQKRPPFCLAEKNVIFWWETPLLGECCCGLKRPTWGRGSEVKNGGESPVRILFLCGDASVIRRIYCRP